MKKKLFAIIIITIIFVVGCNAKHCVKIGGDYQGMNGELEYCYDGTQSTAEGAPVFVGQDGSKNVLLKESDVVAINKLLDGDKVSASAMPATTPMRDLLKKVRQAAK